MLPGSRERPSNLAPTKNRLGRETSQPNDFLGFNFRKKRPPTNDGKRPIGIIGFGFLFGFTRFCIPISFVTFAVRRENLAIEPTDTRAIRRVLSRMFVNTCFPQSLLSGRRFSAQKEGVLELRPHLASCC